MRRLLLQLVSVVALAVLLLPGTAHAHRMGIAQAERFAQRVADDLAATEYDTWYASVTFCRRRGGTDPHWVNCYARWPFAFDGNARCTGWIAVRYRNSYSHKKSWLGPLLERCD